MKENIHILQKNVDAVESYRGACIRYHKYITEDASYL
jgi:hypothetical protein